MSAKWYFLLYLTRCFLFTWLKFSTPSDLQKGDFGLRSWQTRGKGKESFILLVFWMLSLYFWPESVNLNTIIDIFKGISLFFFKEIFRYFSNFYKFCSFLKNNSYQNIVNYIRLFRNLEHTHSRVSYGLSALDSFC